VPNGWQEVTSSQETRSSRNRGLPAVCTKFSLTISNNQATSGSCSRICALVRCPMADACAQIRQAEAVRHRPVLSVAAAAQSAERNPGRGGRDQVVILVMVLELVVLAPRISLVRARPSILTRYPGAGYFSVFYLDEAA
jgi:hypothetical protein